MCASPSVVALPRGLPATRHARSLTVQEYTSAVYFPILLRKWLEVPPWQTRARVLAVETVSGWQDKGGEEAETTRAAKTHMQRASRQCEAGERACCKGGRGQGVGRARRGLFLRGDGDNVGAELRDKDAMWIAHPFHTHPSGPQDTRVPRPHPGSDGRSRTATHSWID